MFKRCLEQKEEMLLCVEKGTMFSSKLKIHFVNMLWQTRLYCHHLFWLLEQSNVSPSEVVQWSNHRVMEWLRSVDLAEYAPNLRGSGVHGGLIVRILFNILLHIYEELTRLYCKPYFILFWSCGKKHKWTFAK